MCHSTSLRLTDFNATLEEVGVPLSAGSAIPTTLARVPGRSAPAILVINDHFGRTDFYRRLCGLLADQGFVAATPEYFHRLGELPENPSPQDARRRRKDLNENDALADLDQVIDWLRGQPYVSGAKVGVLGFCLGGTFAFNLAAGRDDLATVAFYGFPGGSDASAVPSPAPITQVDRLNGPILAFWGSADPLVRLDLVAEFASRSTARGIEFEHVVYDGLGHGFMAGDSEAVSEAWQRTVRFFRANLQDR